MDLVASFPCPAQCLAGSGFLFLRQSTLPSLIALGFLEPLVSDSQLVQCLSCLDYTGKLVFCADVIADLFPYSAQCLVSGTCYVSLQSFCVRGYRSSGPFSCRQAQDPLHHGRSGSEGQLPRGIQKMVLLGDGFTMFPYTAQCLDFSGTRYQQFRMRSGLRFLGSSVRTWHAHILSPAPCIWHLQDVDFLRDSSRNVPIFCAVWLDSGYMFVSVYEFVGVSVWQQRQVRTVQTVLAVLSCRWWLRSTWFDSGYMNGVSWGLHVPFSL